MEMSHSFHVEVSDNKTIENDDFATKALGLSLSILSVFGCDQPQFGASTACIANGFGANPCLGLLDDADRQSTPPLSQPRPSIRAWPIRMLIDEMNSHAISTRSCYAVMATVDLAMKEAVEGAADLICIADIAGRQQLGQCYSGQSYSGQSSLEQLSGKLCHADLVCSACGPASEFCRSG